MASLTNKRMQLVIAAVLTAVVVIYGLSLDGYDHATINKLKENKSLNLPAMIIPERNNSERHKDPSTVNQLNDFLHKEIVAILRQYGSDIENISVQVSLVELRDYIVNIDPVRGYQLFIDAVREVFPDHADDILQAVKSMDQYNRWLLENTREFSFMSDVDKDQQLWIKRKELFGDAANQIWSSEIAAYENRKNAIRETIAELSQSAIISNDEKLYQLQDSLEQVYAYSIDGFILNKGLVSKVFLSMETVQQELAAMDADLRQQRIDEYRQRMGFSAPVIERLRERDIDRNQRWDNGLTYMDARSELEQKYSGEQLEQQMAVLRDKHFKHEARTIELEEESGFYRYRRPRVHGRN